MTASTYDTTPAPARDMRMETEGNVWTVKAEWYGAERTVFSDPSPFACVRFMVENGQVQ